MKTVTVTIILSLTGSVSFGNNGLSLQIERNDNQIAIDLVLSNEDTLSGMQIPLDLSMSNLVLEVA